MTPPTPPSRVNLHLVTLANSGKPSNAHPLQHSECRYQSTLHPTPPSPSIHPLTLRSREVCVCLEKEAGAREHRKVRVLRRFFACLNIVLLTENRNCTKYSRLEAALPPALPSDHGSLRLFAVRTCSAPPGQSTSSLLEAKSTIN